MGAYPLRGAGSKSVSLLLAGSGLRRLAAAASSSSSFAAAFSIALLIGLLEAKAHSLQSRQPRQWLQRQHMRAANGELSSQAAVTNTWGSLSTPFKQHNTS